MVFVFDLDDTICETDAFSKEYISSFFVEHNLPYKQVQDVARFAERYFDWDMQTALQWYKQYGDEMMLKFPCKAGVSETINRLHELGHKIVIATARATDWHVEPEKISKQWLNKNNIKYDKLYTGRIDKEKICEEESADVFVDDDISITSKVAEHFDTVMGKKKKYVFLATTLFNNDKEVGRGVTRINSFNDMLKIIEN